MTFEKLFVSLDMLAPPIQLNIGGRPAHKTLFGGLLTLCQYAVLVTAVVYIFQKSLSRENPICFNELQAGTTYPTFNLAASNHQPMFMFFINEVDTMTTDMFPKYFTADCMQVTWTASESGSGDYQIVRTPKFFPVVPCKSLPRDKQHYRNYVDRNSTFYSLIEDSGMCVDTLDEFSVFGRNSDDVSVEMVVRLRPCSLDSGCASFEELRKVNFYMGFPNTNIDLTNYENPYSQSLTADDIYYINPDLHQMNRISMRTSEVWDFEGLIPDWTFRSSIKEIHKVFTTSMSRDRANIKCPTSSLGIMDETDHCRSYFQISIQSSGVTNRLRRRYRTYSEMFGEIGGVKEVLFVLFAAIYFFPNKRSLHSELVSRVFNWDSKPAIASDAAFAKPIKENEIDVKDGPSTVKDSLQGSAGPKMIMTQNSSELRRFSNNGCFSCTTDKKASQILETLDVIWMIRELHKLKFLSRYLLPKDLDQIIPQIMANKNPMPHDSFPVLNGLSCEFGKILSSANLVREDGNPNAVPYVRAAKSNEVQPLNLMEASPESEITLSPKKVNTSAKPALSLSKMPIATRANQPRYSTFLSYSKPQNLH